MRLLIIAEKYPPIVGGGETHLEQLATGLVQAGHHVTVATDRAGISEPREHFGVRVINVPGLAPACREFSCRSAVTAVHAVLSSECFDGIHVINYVPALIVGWLRSCIDVPVFFSTFETFIENERVFGMFGNYPLEACLQRGAVAALKPDLIVCGSLAYKRWALAGGAKEQIVRVVPHATDASRFAAVPSVREAFRRKRGWANDEFVFLVPARPVPRKRIEDVLAAMTRIHSGRRVRVVLTAPEGRCDADYVGRLERQVRESGIDHCVDWERGLELADMPALYNACDAVVVPSSNEGFCIAILEAMAATRPVIATDIEGPNEFVIDGVTGRLFPPNDVDALAIAMVDTITRDTSDVVQRAARMVLTQYSISSMVTGHLDAYRECIPRRVTP